MSQPQIAIVYDRANTQFGGAEHLLLVLQKVFPESHLFTPLAHQSAQWQNKFARVKTSWLQNLPLASTHHQWVFPLMPLAIESFDLSDYQVIISLTSAESKGVLTKPDQFHLSYILTPPRYIYDLKLNYPSVTSWIDLPFLGWLLQIILKYLMAWDKVATARPDKIITLSRKIAVKIDQIYQREAEVIYPPVQDLSQIDISYIPAQLSQTPPFWLSVSRLVEYKRVDLAIESALKLKHALFVVGTGPDMKRLQTLAGNQSWTRPADMNFETALAGAKSRQQLINFLGNVNQAELVWLYRHTQVVLSLGNEDFGLVPLEAAQFGTPSVISAQSGVAEVLSAPQLSAQISDCSVNAVKSALAELFQHSISAAHLQTTAKSLADELFQKRMTQMVYHEFRNSKQRKQT